MARIYLGDLPLGKEVAAKLTLPGFEPVIEATPDEPGEDELSLVQAHVGITAVLRHRLNNPLTAVMGFAELLLRDTSLSPSVEKKVRQIQANAIRLSEMLHKPQEAPEVT